MSWWSFSQEMVKNGKTSKRMLYTSCGIFFRSRRVSFTTRRVRCWLKNAVQRGVSRGENAVRLGLERKGEGGRGRGGGQCTKANGAVEESAQVGT